MSGLVEIDDLVLVRRDQEPGGVLAGGAVMLTPPIGEDYWAYSVGLSEAQAVLGFPKFGTVGIGYAVEDADWNRNLPWTCPADIIEEWIRPNMGVMDMPTGLVIAAIELIRAAVKVDEKVSDAELERLETLHRKARS